MAARRISSAVILLRSRPNSKPPCGPRIPLTMPSRTRACRTGSRCRGGRRCRAASAFAETGRARALMARQLRQQWRGGFCETSTAFLGTTHGSTRYQWYYATPADASRCKRWRLLIQLPVDPKPPLPRWVLSRDATSEICARTTGAITSWATRVPRVIATGALPKLASRTWISPR
jgi:hypothetical protein